MSAAVTEARPARPQEESVGAPTVVEPELPRPATLRGRYLFAAGVLLAAATVVGLVLRFWTHSALWLDEALTVNIARLPLHDLHGALRRDGAPPLYYLLLHFWMQVFGGSDVAVRALSGALSVLTLPLVLFAGRRYGGRTVGWVVVALVATAPFAVYYATEVRMYALVMFLTACGFVAMERSLRRPRPGNLLAVAVVTAGLLYSQYWALYLVAMVVLWLIWLVSRGPVAGRRPAWWSLGAVVVGCLAFIPWVPTFLFQSAHTGTPWSAAPNFSAIINAVTGFTVNQASVNTASNQGRLLAVLYFLLAALALFGVARDRWHIDIDLRTRRPARGLAFIVAATLVVAIGGGIISGSAFSPRYAAVVFIPLMVLLALGSLTFASPKLRAVIVLVAAAAGLVTAVQNVSTQRTQATSVAAVLARHAQAGDVVAFCPDQLGPATYRLMPPNRYVTTTFPRGTSPAFVDWVDYSQAVKRTNPATFADGLVRKQGATHRIWMVWAPGYQGFTNRCEQMIADVSNTPKEAGRTWLSPNGSRYYEPMGLIEFSRSP